MSVDKQIFSGCMPALMTPCSGDGIPDWDALVETGRGLVDAKAWRVCARQACPLSSAPAHRIPGARSKSHVMRSKPGRPA